MHTIKISFIALSHLADLLHRKSIIRMKNYKTELKCVFFMIGSNKQDTVKSFLYLLGIFIAVCLSGPD